MSVQDEPDDRVSSGEEAELRALRRIASALERDDIDELAAALYRDDRRSGAGAGGQSVAEKESDSL